jgi:hypothetical protein
MAPLSIQNKDTLQNKKSKKCLEDFQKLYMLESLYKAAMIKLKNRSTSLQMGSFGYLRKKSKFQGA